MRSRFIRSFKTKSHWTLEAQKFNAGEEASSVYFVAHGQVELVHSDSEDAQNERKASSNENVILRTLHPGEMLGIFSMLNDWNYHCTAKANGKTLCCYR